RAPSNLAGRSKWVNRGSPEREVAGQNDNWASCPFSHHSDCMLAKRRQQTAPCLFAHGPRHRKTQHFAAALLILRFHIRRGQSPSQVPENALRAAWPTSW